MVVVVSGERERIGGLVMVHPTIAAFGDAVAEDDLRTLAARPDVGTLQCSKPVHDSVWRLLNEAFFPLRPDVTLRVFGYYGKACDLSFAARMTNVRHFSADCLLQATGVEAIAEMPQLESLSLDIYELKDFAILDRLPVSLTSLDLGRTSSKRPSVAALARFRSLTSLSLDGQSRGIESLAALADLQRLALRSVTTPNLAYLAPLERLDDVAIQLGGIRSFEGLAGKASVRHLECWQIRGLEHVDVLGTLPGVQQVSLQSLAHVRAFPRLDRCVALRRLLLTNMKGLTDLSALETAPALEEFAFAEAQAQQPEQLMPVLRNPAVRSVSVGFGSDRRNQAFERLRHAHGKADWRFTPFQYR